MTSADQDIQSTIHQAIQSARYNAAVIVSVTDNDDNAREIVLVACLDREHGGIVWRDAASSSAATPDNFHVDKDTSDDTKHEDIGIQRHLRTKLWAIPMLNDHIRNEMYNTSVREACRAAVEKRVLHPNEDETIRILDIGSGTGLIALMAARHCRDAIVDIQKKTQHGKKMKVQVTSCEMASAMARLARMTINENKTLLNNESGVGCEIVVVECHSTDVDFAIRDSRFGKKKSNDLKQQQVEEPKKADICTSELLDSGLLGEGVLPSLRDAWERHLKPNAVVLPMAARVVAVLVSGCPLSEEQNSGEPNILPESRLNGATLFYGPDLKSFQRASGGVWLATTPQDDKSCNNKSPDGILLGSQNSTSDMTSSESFGIIIPLHANAILESQCTSLADPSQEYDGFSLSTGANKSSTMTTGTTPQVRCLTDPKTVLTLDFASGLKAFPSSGSVQSTVFVPTSSGNVDGVLFWWELDLGPGTHSTYSTEPIGYFNNQESSDSKMQWQDHWQQCLFLFADGDSTRDVTEGHPIQINTSHDEYSISFAISTPSDEKETARPATRRKLDDGSDGTSSHATMNKHISPARALQLNDSKRTATLRDAILFALNLKGKNSPLLDLSDMSVCAMIAAVAGGASCVTSLESGMSTLAATISQLGNGLPSKDGDTFQVIQALSENVTIDYIAGGPAEIVCGEPYYQMLEGWHIQEALNYFYLIKSFRSRQLISESAVSVPSLACIMVCVVEFQDFCNAYGEVGCEDMVQGFRHKAVNQYGNRYHTHDVSLPLWQYNWKRLSEPVCVATLNYEGNVAIDHDTWVSAKFERPGSADAVVFWVDYLCHTTSGTHTQTSKNDGFNVISTASSSHRQTIRKLLPAFSITTTDLKGKTKFVCRSKFDEGENECVDDHYFSYKIIQENKDVS